MAINYVDIGIIANDGTGDDLREAMTKINNNFEELDSRIVETTQIENAGALGAGVYSGKRDGIETFKRVLGGDNISVTTNDNTITITGANSLDQLIAVTDNGTVTVSRGQTLSVVGGEVITTRVTGQSLFIDLDNTGIVARDSAPELTANLIANNNNISGVNVVSATTFNGELQGNVWGYDVRTFGSYLQGFDFGNFRQTYTSSIEFIMQNVDLDLGAFTPESGDEVDLGYFV